MSSPSITRSRTGVADAPTAIMERLDAFGRCLDAIEGKLWLIQMLEDQVVAWKPSTLIGSHFQPPLIRGIHPHGCMSPDRGIFPRGAN
ncbi:hypothetical protein GUJ93_ZPchr0011g27131 [Zizania palustris]|uniref:Uncharacterized protein n=1 Tax=Zizania palustris TaxID=103762 RepID=A0A8J5WJH8_ZIZPA|nr:hypothetical protein GUJ93_ZPchr0011g27131 [Zizania palustris]